MLASELMKLLKSAIDEFGDHEVIADPFGSGYANLVVDVELEEWPYHDNGGDWVKETTTVFKMAADDSSSYSFGEN